MSGQRRLGILASHPIQYQAPIFRELAKRVDLQVFFAHRQTAEGQARAGFSVPFEWDVDVLAGYTHTFLPNVSARPGTDHFRGCDTPAVAAAVAEGRFDAFLVMGWNLLSYWQAVRACRRYGVPVMVRGDSQLGTQRGALKKAAKRLIYPVALRQFDACLHVGQRSRAYFEAYGVPASRLFRSPHCVDDSRFSAGAAAAAHESTRRELGIPSTAKVALFVGRLVDSKRVDTLLRAAALSRARGVDIHVLVVGDGPMRRALEQEAARLGLPATFTGFWNQGRLPIAYSAADVLVLPSDARETWGLVVNEAFACGIPAVVSDQAGCAPDLVRRGATGEIFACGDESGLAAALEAALAHPPDASAIRGIVASHSPAAAADGILAAMEAMRLERTT